MTEVIASAVVDLARVAVAAYVVHFGGKALLLYVEKLPQPWCPTNNEVIDTARARGYEVQA